MPFIGQLMVCNPGRIATFRHGWRVHRLLQSDYLDVNLPQDFQIPIAKTSLRLLKRLIMDGTQ